MINMNFQKEYFLYIIDSEGEEKLLTIMDYNQMNIAIFWIGKSFASYLEFCNALNDALDDYNLYFAITKAAGSPLCWIEEKTIWREQHDKPRPTTHSQLRTKSAK